MQIQIIEKRKWNEDEGRYTDAIGKCVCGGTVYLDSFTNECDCGRDYNSFGQQLAPRAQWGEETGESISDIMTNTQYDPEEVGG